MAKENLQPANPDEAGRYSHVAKVSGGTLAYIAGQVSADTSGQLAGEGNLAGRAGVQEPQGRGEGGRRHHGRYHQDERLSRRRGWRR